MKRKNSITLFIGWIAIALAPGQTIQGADNSLASVSTLQTGSISGQVSNAATKYFLEGAVVQLVGTDRVTTTDRLGRYQFSGIQRETATLAVSFAGLDTVQIPVAINPGQMVVHNIELTASVYKLEEYRVVGEREGSALAIMQQRAAPNVKNVVATDAFGAQTTDNVGNFLMRLPGLTASMSAGDVSGVMIRGIDGSLNTVEMDGIQLASTDPTGLVREFGFSQASISSVESIEVTKAPTPDRPANSIGGSINLVTGSAFRRNGGRLFAYSIGALHTIGRIGGQAEENRRYDEPIKKITPTMTFSYSDILGEKRKLGIMMTFSRQTVFAGGYDAVMGYQVTLAQPAYINLFSPRVASVQGPSTRQSESAKLEYKLNEATVLAFNAVHTSSLSTNDVRTFTLQAANNAASYMPGYSEAYTEARPLTTTTAGIPSQSSYNSLTDNYRIQTSAVHRRAGWTVDFSGTVSGSNARQKYTPWSRKPQGVIAITGLNNIGFIIDRRKNPAWPTVTQTAGPDIYNLANYTTMTMTQNNRQSNTDIMEAHLNVRKDFSLPVPAFIKTGLAFHQERRDADADFHSYRFAGTGGLAQFIDKRSWVKDEFRGLRQGPWVDPVYVAQYKEDNPNQWTEDFYTKYSQNLLNEKDFREEITSAYMMGNVQLNSLNIMGGIRVEDTDVLGNGPVRRITPAEQARRTAWVGPVTEAEGKRRAEAELGIRTHASGEYRNVFPGIHLKYAPRSGFVARGSYSTSIGRPPIGSIIPNVNVNDASQTLSISNPGLKPQYSDNFDLNLEYYYEPIGIFSVSVFLKELSGFIFTDSSQFVGRGPNNGYDGLYENYRITTTANGGHARYRGFELNYQQQFTFLPGFWSGFGVNMNYTQLQTKGDYGGLVATTQVAEFKPRTANFVLSYQKNRYKFSALANWVDDYLLTVSTNPASFVYETQRLLVGARFNYTLTHRTNLYLNLDNITKSPVFNRYIVYKDRGSWTRQVYPQVSLGIQGRL